MFFRGENTTPQTSDYRPEVHDSDGVLLATASGEWIWRPLKNPRRLQTSSLALTDPKGFGLIQRDRDFDHYQDLETRPDLRPSVWIVPRSGFEDGGIELVEIPTRTDTNDNIVTFWVPKESLAAGEPLRFAYKMHWYGEGGSLGPPAGRAVATRHDTGTFDDAHRIIVDFEGGKLGSLPPETVLRGVVTLGRNTADEAELLEQQVVKNTVTGGWRLTFQVRPKQDQPLEMRAFLQLGKEALTETWSYAIEP
jgi:glucans biosynthesis protein